MALPAMTTGPSSRRRNDSVVLRELPGGVEELRPFFHESVFADAVIEEAYDVLLKCRNVADRSRTSFGEVDHQLADHDAWSVDELAGNARDLRTDLSTTARSLKTMLA